MSHTKVRGHNPDVVYLVYTGQDCMEEFSIGDKLEQTVTEVPGVVIYADGVYEAEVDTGLTSHQAPPQLYWCVISQGVIQGMTRRTEHWDNDRLVLKERYNIVAPSPMLWTYEQYATRAESVRIGESYKNHRQENGDPPLPPAYAAAGRLRLREHGFTRQVIMPLTTGIELSSHQKFELFKAYYRKRHHCLKNPTFASGVVEDTYLWRPYYSEQNRTYRHVAYLYVMELFEMDLIRLEELGREFAHDGHTLGV